MDLTPVATTAMGIAGALLGALVQSLISKAARAEEADRAENRLQREWSKDVYVRLIAAIDRAERGMGKGRIIDPNTLEFAEPTLWKEEGGLLVAAVIGVGSDEVKEAMEEFKSRHLDFYLRLEDIHENRRQGHNVNEEARALNEVRKEIFNVARRLEDQIRSELRPPKAGGRGDA